jgi:hypothetical protein
LKQGFFVSPDLKQVAVAIALLSPIPFLPMHGEKKYVDSFVLKAANEDSLQKILILCFDDSKIFQEWKYSRA